MQENSLTILYEDRELLVCVKPRGILSAKDASGKTSAADLLQPRTLYPVHRLDREACGRLVLAKTRESAAFLSGIMGSGFSKEYLAVCEGCPPEEGELTDLLFHDRRVNKTYVVKWSKNSTSCTNDNIYLATFDLLPLVIPFANCKRTVKYSHILSET